LDASESMTNGLPAGRQHAGASSAGGDGGHAGADPAGITLRMQWSDHVMRHCAPAGRRHAGASGAGGDGGHAGAVPAGGG